jgi:hypothetical protein
VSTVGKDWKGKKDDKEPTEDDKKLMAQKMVHQRRGSHDKLPKD